MRMMVILPSAECIQKQICGSWAEFLGDGNKFSYALNAAPNPTVYFEVNKICRFAFSCFSLNMRIILFNFSFNITV